MRVVLLVAALCCGGAVLCAGQTCGPPPHKQLFRDMCPRGSKCTANYVCGTNCGDICFQKVVEANMYVTRALPRGP